MFHFARHLALTWRMRKNGKVSGYAARALWSGGRWSMLRVKVPYGLMCCSHVPRTGFTNTRGSCDITSSFCR